MKDLYIFLLSVLLGAIGQVVLKKGASRIGDLSLSLFSVHKEVINLIKIPEIILDLFSLELVFYYGLKY